MPRFEIEVDDKGDFVGDVPSELGEILKRSEIAAYGNGVRNGKSTAAEEAKKQIEESVRLAKAQWESSLPLEREQWQRAEEEAKALKAQVLDLSRAHQKTLQQREDQHAEERLRLAESVKQRDTRIKHVVMQNLKALAAQAGARDESLPELEVIFGSSIGFDDTMEPFVAGSDGQPRLLHGKPITLAQFVKDYLDTHPHHRKPDPRRGGYATGGASLRGGSGERPSTEGAEARIHSGDRTAGAINELFEAHRKRVN